MATAASLPLVPDRLRQARETTGQSTRSVARQLQLWGYAVSHTTIANYETGKSMPSHEILTVLAKVYERQRDWFYSTGPTFAGLRYRALKAVRASDKQTFEGNALSWFIVYLTAEARGLDPVEPPKDLVISHDDSGRDVAQRIRDHYGFKTFPIPSIARLLENFGIRVIQVESTARIDGFAALLGEVRVVAVNSRLSNDRIRMNLAHELAHHLFKDCITGGKLPDDEIERRAMECASHLLIPDEPLRQAFALKSMVRLVQYKERYGISLAAMIFRAKQSRILSDHLYKHLWVEFGRLGWRKDEPGYVAPDRPLRMEAILDAAIEQRLMSTKEIAAIVGVDERAVRQRIAAARGGLASVAASSGHLGPMHIDYYRREQSDLKEI